MGHIEDNKLIAELRHTVETLVNRITRAKANRYPIAINLEMYEDGSVSPTSIKLMKEVRRKLEGL